MMKDEAGVLHMKEKVVAFWITNGCGKTLRYVVSI